jgi:hypothetical protein
MIEILEEPEDEAIETELYLEHYAKRLSDFVDGDNETVSPLNFSADQNGSIALKYYIKVVAFPVIAQSFQKLRREDIIIPRAFNMFLFGDDVLLAGT